MSSQIAILSFADPSYPLIGLADQLPWNEIEASLASLEFAYPIYAASGGEFNPKRLKFCPSKCIVSVHFISDLLFGLNPSRKN